MKKIFFVLFFVFFLLFSCKYKFVFKTMPDDAHVFVNEQKIDKSLKYISENNSFGLDVKRYGYLDYERVVKKILPFGTKKVKIKMEPQKFFVEINLIDGTSDVVKDTKVIGTTPLKLELKYGAHPFTLRREKYPDQQIIVEAKREGKLFFKHLYNKIPVKQVGIFDCGSQPKQIIFSPDDNFIFITLLDGFGFEVFDLNSLSIKDYIKAPDTSKSKGFPEGLFIEEKGVFWVSQMTTGKIYEYSYPDLKFLRIIKTGGIWPKFMAWSSKLGVVVISNWATNDVSVIEYASGKVIKKIPTAAAPRGLAFTKGSDYLLITCFDGGKILKINTSNWQEEKSIYKENAAMRHVVVANNNKLAYVNNMMHARVYEVNIDDFSILNTFRVDYNTNTMSLTPDERFLFASGRGPNDEESYLNRSPRSGKIAIIDLLKKEVVSFIEGGNQPTGLGISNNGKYLCFSNFRDNNIEIYYIDGISNEK